MGDFIDKKTVTITDLDIHIDTVKAHDKKLGHQRIPGDAIIRYNFLELIIRITNSKYLKSNICSTWEEAI